MEGIVPKVKGNLVKTYGVNPNVEGPGFTGQVQVKQEVDEDQSLEEYSRDLFTDDGISFVGSLIKREKEEDEEVSDVDSEKWMHLEMKGGDDSDYEEEDDNLVNSDSDASNWSDYEAPKRSKRKSRSTFNRLGSVRVIPKRKREFKSEQKESGSENEENVTSTTTIDYNGGDDTACEICGEKDINPNEILAHVRNHVGEEYLRKCPNFPQCPKAFCHRYSLRSHLEHSLSCRKLILEGQVAETSPSYVALNKKDILSCDHCNVNLWNFEYLQAHLTRKHEAVFPEEKLLPCPISGCSKIFHLGQSLEVHLLLQHDVNYKKNLCIIQICGNPKCGQRLSVTQMEDHLKKVHRTTETIRCDQCPYLFSSRELLCDHLYAVHRHSREPLHCDICESGFSDHLQLRAHYYEEHQIGKKLTCTKCPEVFWTKAMLRTHILRAHEAISCSICKENGVKASFHSKAALYNHKIKEHGAKLYECTKCSATFSTEFTLKNHIKQEHMHIPRKGPWICKVPGCMAKKKVYSSRSGYKHHMVTVHRNQHEKTGHECSECGRPFTCPSQLKRHFVTVHQGERFHKGEKAWKCDICGLEVAHSSALKRHKMTHSKQRPYKCTDCDKKYKDRRSLQEHVKNHHGDIEISE